MELQAKHNREQPRKTQKTAKRPEQNEMKQEKKATDTVCFSQPGSIILSSGSMS